MILFGLESCGFAGVDACVLTPPTAFSSTCAADRPARDASIWRGATLAGVGRQECLPHAYAGFIDATVLAHVWRTRFAMGGRPPVILSEINDRLPDRDGGVAVFVFVAILYS